MLWRPRPQDPAPAPKRAGAHQSRLRPPIAMDRPVHRGQIPRTRRTPEDRSGLVQFHVGAVPIAPHPVHQSQLGAQHAEMAGVADPQREL